MNAPIVTLTTDWGDSDFYAGRIKGKLISLIPNVRIVDVSHSQSNAKMSTLADVIRYGCMSFPQGTIHIIDVGCEPRGVESFRNDDNNSKFVPSPVAVLYNGHIFIATEIQSLSFAFDNPPSEAVLINVPESLPSYTFLADDLYCDLVSRLVKGAALTSLGKNFENIPMSTKKIPSCIGNEVVVRVTHVDHYGNAMLDITNDQFEEIRQGRDFVFSFVDVVTDYTINTISKHYNNVRISELLLTISSTGCLQLAVNGGSAVDLFEIRPPITCRFVFK